MNFEDTCFDELRKAQQLIKPPIAANKETKTESSVEEQHRKCMRLLPLAICAMARAQTEVPRRSDSERPLVHRCSHECQWFVYEKVVYICEESGNLHFCDELICDHIFDDEEARTCVLTGNSYRCQFVDHIFDRMGTSDRYSVDREATKNMNTPFPIESTLTRFAFENQDPASMSTYSNRTSRDDMATWMINTTLSNHWKGPNSAVRSQQHEEEEELESQDSAITTITTTTTTTTGNTTEKKRSTRKQSAKSSGSSHTTAAVRRRQAIMVPTRELLREQELKVDRDQENLYHQHHHYPFQEAEADGLLTDRDGTSNSSRNHYHQQQQPVLNSAFADMFSSSKSAQSDSTTFGTKSAASRQQKKQKRLEEPVVISRLHTLMENLFERVPALKANLEARQWKAATLQLMQHWWKELTKTHHYRQHSGYYTPELHFAVIISHTLGGLTWRTAPTSTVLIPPMEMAVRRLFPAERVIMEHYLSMRAKQKTCSLKVFNAMLHELAFNGFATAYKAVKQRGASIRSRPKPY